MWSGIPMFGYHDSPFVFKAAIFSWHSSSPECLMRLRTGCYDRCFSHLNWGNILFDLVHIPLIYAKQCRGRNGCLMLLTIGGHRESHNVLTGLKDAAQLLGIGRFTVPAQVLEILEITCGGKSQTSDVVFCLFGVF